MELGSPVKWMIFAVVFSWTLCFITNKKGAEPSKPWFFSFMLPYERWCSLTFRWIVRSLRDQYVALCSGFCDHFPSCFPFTKGDESAKTVPVRCCFPRTDFWPFHSIDGRGFDRIYPGGKHFVGIPCWPNFVSHCCLCWVSLTVPKHLDFCSTFHKADVTPRALSSHFVSWS